MIDVHSDDLDSRNWGVHINLWPALGLVLIVLSAVSVVSFVAWVWL